MRRLSKFPKPSLQPHNSAMPLSRRDCSKKKTTYEEFQTICALINIAALCSGAAFLGIFFGVKIMRSAWLSSKDALKNARKFYYRAEIAEKERKAFCEKFPNSTSYYNAINELPADLQNLFSEKEQEEFPIYFSYEVIHARLNEVNLEIWSQINSEFFSQDLQIGFNALKAHLDILEANNNHTGYFGYKHDIRIRSLRCHRGDVSIELIPCDTVRTPDEVLTLLYQRKHCFTSSLAEQFLNEAKNNVLENSNVNTIVKNSVCK